MIFKQQEDLKLRIVIGKDRLLKGVFTFRLSQFKILNFPNPPRLQERMPSNYPETCSKNSDFCVTCPESQFLKNQSESPSEICKTANPSRRDSLSPQPKTCCAVPVMKNQTTSLVTSPLSSHFTFDLFPFPRPQRAAESEIRCIGSLAGGIMTRRRCWIHAR